jgi:hypothetical protein
VLLVLLPDPLERFAQRELVEALLAAGVATVVDPPRTSYRRIARIPEAFGLTVSLKQARRLRRRLRSDPRALVIFDPAQYPLARALLMLLPECELWYEHSSPVPADDPRLTELHALAAERARVRFTGDDRQTLEDALQRL